MGTDSKLWHKKSNRKIYCDRLYNLKNSFVKAKGLQDYLLNNGLPKFMLVDLCTELDDLTDGYYRNKPAGHKSTYREIIEGLESFDDNDILILIDEHNENYFDE